MLKRKVSVSFDYDRDRNYYLLLKAWNENPSIEFSIIDRMHSEIQSGRVDVDKRVLSRKINEANVTLALIGEDINKPHPTGGSSVALTGRTMGSGRASTRAGGPSGLGWPGATGCLMP